MYQAAAIPIVNNGVYPYIYVYYYTDMNVPTNRAWLAPVK